MAFNLRTSGIPALQNASTLAKPDVLPAFGAPGTIDQLRDRLQDLWDATSLLINADRAADYRFPERLLWETMEALNLFKMTHGISLPDSPEVGHLHADYSQEGVPLRPLVWDGEDWVNYSPDIQPGGVMLDVILAPFLVNQGIVNAGNQALVNALRDELRAGAPSGRDTFNEISALIDTLQAAVAGFSFANPAFTGVPTAPTAAPGTNTTQLATTAFAKAAADAAAGASVPLAQKGAASGVATLDSGGKVPVAQLPSYVEDVIEVANFASLPGTGQASKLYVTTNNGKVFRWAGSAYVEIVGSPGSTDAVPEGTTNKYFTDARAQAVVQASAAIKALTYAALTAIVSPSNNMLVTVLGRSAPGDSPSSDWYFDAAATDTPNGGTILQPDAGGTGRWKMIWKGTLSASHFGTDGTAIAAAMAVSKRVRVGEGTWVFAANTTLPAGRKLRLDPGALLSVNTGVTLTLRCELIDAPVERLFTGAGTVVGLRTVRPEFFGAARDDSTDDIVAFEKAMACLQGSLSTVGARPTFIMSAGRYVLSRSWVVSVSSTFGPEIYGAGPLLGGTTLVAKTGFNHAAGGLLAIEGQTGSITQLADYIIRDFQIGAIDVGVGLGLSFNHVQTNLISHIGKSKVENINISNFQYNLWAARLSRVDFDRCSFWNKDIASGFNVNAYLIDGVSGASAFAGEITFTNCDFVQVSTNASGFNVILASLVAGGALAAVRLERCTFYKAATMLRLEMASGGGLGDIWVTNCQFDGPQTKAIDIAQLGASSSTAMSNIHIKGNYFTANAGTMITMLAAKAGGINSVIVTDNYSAGAQAAVNMQNVNGAVVTANKWGGISWSTFGSWAMAFDACKHLTVNDNNFGQAGPAMTGTFTYMLQFTGACDWVTAQGNNSCGLATGAIINDAMTGTNKSIPAGSNI